MNGTGKLKGRAVVAPNPVSRSAPDNSTVKVTPGITAEKSGESFSAGTGGGVAQLDPPNNQNAALSLAAGRVLRQGIDDARVQRLNGPYVPEEQFIDRLAQTPEQTKVLGALTTNREFRALWSWFSRFPGGNPIRFVVQPGLKMGGVERFGGFFGRELMLLVNPAKREHVENPQELVNTIVHELVHAALNVAGQAKDKGLSIAPPPLPEGATDLPHDETFYERFRGWSPQKWQWRDHPEAWAYLTEHYGDSDSTPELEFIDVNRQTQALVLRVVAENLAATGIGHPTITGVEVA